MIDQMRLTLSLFTIAAVTVTACSIQSKRVDAAPSRAPSAQVDKIDPRKPKEAESILEKQYKENPTPAMRTLTHYLEAQIWAASGNPNPVSLAGAPSPSPLTKSTSGQVNAAEKGAEKACALWLDIMNDPKFVLRQLARLRAIEVCKTEPPPLPDALPNWLTEAAARISLKRAILTKDRETEMHSAIEVAAFEKVPRDRTRLLQRAYDLAVERKDPVTTAQAEALLEKAAPRLIINPKPEQYLFVANDYKQVRDFSSARAYLQKIIASDKNPPTEKLKAFEGIRMTYKLQKETPKYLAATEQMAAFAKEKFFIHPAPLSKSLPTSYQTRMNFARYYDAQLALARAVWTEHHPSQATQILLKVESDLQGRYAIDESYLIRARIAEEAGDLKKALAILALSKTSAIDDHDLRAKILWNRAWDMRKAKLIKDAIPQFEELGNDDTNAGTQMRAKYWLARALSESGQNDKAKIEYEWLVANDLVGYYGLLAYRELKRPMPTPKISPISADSGDLSLQGVDRETADWLVATGEFDLAKVYIDQSSAPKRGSYSAAQQVDLLHLYAQAMSYQTLFTRLWDLGVDTRKKILETHADLVFPEPWRTTASEASEKFSVPIELIYAIMRQESSFNPTARSGADAFGLMQLIPEMARRASEKSGLVYQSPEDLYQPEINIPLGASFLHQLMAHWKGQFILTTASYNASENAIASWVQTRYAGDPVQFIEDIPYEETRNYIKLVLRNYIFYMRLNANGSSVPFPEHCLENLQAIKP